VRGIEFLKVSELSRSLFDRGWSLKKAGYGKSLLQNFFFSRSLPFLISGGGTGDPKRGLKKKTKPLSFLSNYLLPRFSGKSPLFLPFGEFLLLKAAGLAGGGGLGFHFFYFTFFPLMVRS